MPTVAEAAEPIVSPILARGCMARPEHLLSAICLDLTERGIRPTPLNLIAYALATGLPEDIAADLGRMVEADEHRGEWRDAA